MPNALTIGDAQRHYKTHTPLHGRSKDHAADLEVISEAPSPLDKAKALVTKRCNEAIDKKIMAMMTELQGRRKRYRYDQSAVMQLEHLERHPFDPQTQAPIWREMIRQSKGVVLSKEEFLKGARAIFRQPSLYDPETMAS